MDEVKPGVIDLPPSAIKIVDKGSVTSRSGDIQLPPSPKAETRAPYTRHILEHIDEIPQVIDIPVDPSKITIVDKPPDPSQAEPNTLFPLSTDRKIAQSAEETFLKNLPPGNSDSVKNVDDAAIHGMEELSKTSALEYFRILQRLKPQDRLRVIKATNLHQLAQSIADAKTSAEQFAIAQAAAGALGEENIRRLALNLTDHNQGNFKTISRERQRASIILAQALSLQDVPAIFAQYGNLARSNTDDLLNPLEMLQFFNYGMDTLARCIERDVQEHPQTFEAIDSQHTETREAFKKNYPNRIDYNDYDTYPPEVIQRISIVNRIVGNDLRHFLERHNFNKILNKAVNEIDIDHKPTINFDAINSVRRHLPGRSYSQENELDDAMSNLSYTWDRSTKRYIPLQSFYS